LVALFFNATITFAQTSALRLNGKIAFTSTRDGDYEIYTMEPDGSNQTRLTNNSGYDISPKWSPDGTKIAFLRANVFQLGYDIYVMNADGSNQTRLTNNLVVVEPPDWSPDGTRIVFHFQSGVGNSFTNEISVVNADGTNLTQLQTRAATPLRGGRLTARASCSKGLLGVPLESM
jgi:Tol biopolymer transport system component